MNQVQNTYTKPDKFRLLVWDYDIKPHEFFALLRSKTSLLKGKKGKGYFTKEWAIARVLENINYYDAMALVPSGELKKTWGKVKQKIFNKTIRDGYEFVLRRHSLPATR